MSDDMNLPIVGLPLAMDSLDKNGVAGLVSDLLAGRDIDVAFSKVQNSQAANDPVSFVVGEYVKWSLYKAVKKNNIVSILGFDLSL